MRLLGALGLVVCLTPACAAPLQRTMVAPGAQAPTRPSAPAVDRQALGRPVIGVAFGGGSARGLAHVGVIRWLEAHRIPIDVVAGTSMGGLVGGVFSTGMTAPQLEAFMSGLDWDRLFGSSAFAYKNIRRKTDGRAYPSHLEFGLKGGLVPPTSLNDGEYVELLLGRLAAPYHDLAHFDELPTPYRAVAVDLVTAQEVVLERGVLADAMRATMSIPLIFPPVQVDGRVLVDGGAMNNVPADVARGMGADRVIAVNVGDLKDREGLSFTMLGLVGATLDAMMRASTLRAIEAADIVIDVPLDDFGSLDWRRAPELVEKGYAAAEAMRDQLLPLALDPEAFAAWQEARQGRRRAALPTPAYVRAEGFASNDQQRLDVLLDKHRGQPIDLELLESDIAVLTGLDRYETIVWRIEQDDAGRPGLVVTGRAKPYAPPFMMLGLNLENTTSSDFRVTGTARYLAFDVGGSGAELRLDGTVGSNPGVNAEWYRPLGPSPFFIAPRAGVATATLNSVDEDTVVARYGQTRTAAAMTAGVNLGAYSDLRASVYVGRLTTTIEVGDPGLPELRGRETGASLTWRLDTQDSPAVPSRGTLAQVTLQRIFNGPDVTLAGESFDIPYSVTQLEGTANRFWSVGRHGRLFSHLAAGTSFDTDDLFVPNQFSLGRPFRLGAYRSGELFGPKYYLATGGYVHQVARLPDFLGGPIFAGGWLENGDVFGRWRDAGWRANASAGVLMETILGPVIIAGSSGFDGRWRTYFGVGRVFR